jgi:hypothetical protein
VKPTGLIIQVGFLIGVNCYFRKGMKMSQCPYGETYTNWLTGETEVNPLYAAWHEGFEAHKLELLAKVKLLETSMRELLAEAKKIKELKRELEKQKSES